MPEDPQRTFETLTRLSTLEDAAARGQLATHRRELLALAEQLPASSPLAPVPRALSAALQLDLAFLRTYPEALLSTLLWRCGPAGDPEAEALGMLAQRWSEERALARPDSVWLRALGRPPHAPGGPLIAELRTAGPHTLLSPMTAEGHVLLDGRGLFHRWDIEEGTLTHVPAVAAPTWPLKLVTRSWDGAALHDARTDTPRHELAMPDGGNANNGSFSPDGALFALAGCGDEYDFGFVNLYDTATGRAVRKWQGPRTFWEAPVFSPDGRRLLAPSEAGLFLWDIETGQQECLPVFKAEGVAFSEDGRRVVTSQGGVVRVWDLGRLRALASTPAEPSRPLAFSPDGQRLVCGDWLCDGATGQRIRKLEIHRGRYLEGGPPRNAFICGTERIVSLEGGIRVWETKSGQPLAHRTDVHYAHWFVTAFSANGRRYAATRQGAPGAEVLDVDTGAVLAKVETQAGNLTCLALSPDGQWLAGGTDEGTIALWNTAGGELLATLSGHEAAINDMAFSLDGRRLVSAGAKEALRLWELPSGARLAARPLDARDPASEAYRPGFAGKRRTWYATPETLGALSGWEGFVGPRPAPFSTEVREGVTLFIDRETGRPAAVFPDAGPWLTRPDGLMWVSPSVQLVQALPAPAAHPPGSAGAAPSPAPDDGAGPPRRPPRG
jgi:WD40 repeat protein